MAYATAPAGILSQRALKHRLTIATHLATAAATKWDTVLLRYKCSGR